MLGWFIVVCLGGGLRAKWLVVGLDHALRRLQACGAPCLTVARARIDYTVALLLAIPQPVSLSETYI